MIWKGIQGTKVIKTEDDVLEQCYGRIPDTDRTKNDKVVVESKTISENDYEPEIETDSDVELSMEDIEPTISHLENQYKKDELISMAESLGLDSSGHKADLAQRIAEYNKG